MLRELVRFVCILVIIASVFVVPIAWLFRRFDMTNSFGVPPESADTVLWSVRIGSTAAVVLAIGTLIWFSTWADPAPDYLQQMVGTAFFDQDGFCFAFGSSVIDRVCYVEVLFQNRYDRPLIGRIAMRPVGGFFSDSEFATIGFEIACAPAAFGIARVPIPVPKSGQGKTQRFEIGASVEYPEGHGKVMRYTGGMTVKKGAEFGASFSTGLTIAAAAVGMIYYRGNDAVDVPVPISAADEVPADCRPEVVTLWKLGDPLLSSTALASVAAWQ